MCFVLERCPFQCIYLSLLDITMEMETTPMIRVGDSWSVEVKLKNTTSDSLNVKLVVGGEILRYDGVAKAKLESHEKSIFLKGFESK